MLPLHPGASPVALCRAAIVTACPRLWSLMPGSHGFGLLAVIPQAAHDKLGLEELKIEVGADCF